MRSFFYAKSVSAMIASHSTRTCFWISSSNHPYEAAIKREAISDFPFLAPMRGFEPPTYRLGAQDVTSYTVIARDFQCRKTLENTGFFSDWTVIRYRLVMPDSC